MHTVKRMTALVIVVFVLFSFVSCNSPTETEKWFYGEQIFESIKNNDSVDHGYQPSILAPIAGILLCVSVFLLGIGNLLTIRQMKKLKARIEKLEKNFEK